jgi:putative DNA primase/helicase
VDVLEPLRTRLQVTRDRGDALEALCPAHDDRHASLSVSVGDAGGIVVHCHAGCATEAVMASLGLRMTDLAGQPRLVATYPYQGPDGAVLYTKERWQPKDFRIRPGLPATAQRVIYNLPTVLWAVANGQPVYVVEGEKDVEALRAVGVVATCNVDGAGVGKWLPHYSGWLADADVVVVADNDDIGIAHARAVFRAVEIVAKSITLQRPLVGKDMAELLAAGWSVNHCELLPADLDDLGMISASTVRPRVVDWAWPGWIAYGCLTTIDGDPGDGKSTLTCDLAARWSTGTAMPDGAIPADRRGVVMISAEDDAATTIVPRLMAAGAHLPNVLLMTGEHDDASPFVLSVDKLAQLDGYLAGRRDIGVVFIDPLMAFWPASVNTYVDADVRAALRPLAVLARRYNVAIVLVRHLTKSATRALYAGSGSIGIVGAARAAFLVKPDPTDATRRVFAPLKMNLAAMPTPLGFQLALSNGDAVAHLEWLGPVEIGLDVLFGGGTTTAPKRDSAYQWLLQVLDGKWWTWDDLDAMAADAGVGSKSTLQRAYADHRGAFATVHNPITPEGITRLGMFLRRADQTGTTQSIGQRHVVNPLGSAAIPDIVTLHATDSDDGEPPGFTDRPKICDICGAVDNPPAAIVARHAQPYWVIRCRAHDPKTYRR